MLNTLVKWLDGFAEWIGRTVAWLSLVLVVVTLSVALLRYGLDFGSVPLQESIIYLHGILFMFGLAYTLKHDEHVRVDVFYQKYDARQRAMLNLAGYLALFMPVVISIFWLSLDYVAASWRVSETSREAGGLPFVYLLKTVIPIMAAQLFLQGIAEILRNLARLQGNGSRS